MAGMKWKIYWDEYASDTYIYGSDIEYSGKNEVHFANRLMPPGTIIKQWYSMVNFQEKLIEPALPIIDGESRYRITVNIDSPTPEGCWVCLVFYDKFENEAGRLIVRDRSREFQCPLKTYSYRMQIINGGMTEFDFYSIEIEELADEDE